MVRRAALLAAAAVAAAAAAVASMLLEETVRTMSLTNLAVAVALQVIYQWLDWSSYHLLF